MPGFSAAAFLRELVLFETGYRFAADREFMIRLALTGIIYARTDTLVYRYCQHSGSLTFNRGNTFLTEMMQEHLKMTDGFLSKAGMPEKARQYLRKMRTRDTLMMAEFHLTKLELGILALSGFVLIASFSVTVVMAQDLLPGKLGMASGLMVGFAIGTGGMGVTLLGLLADTWGVPTALKTITVMPIMGFLLCLFLTSASFHRSKGSPG